MKKIGLIGGITWQSTQLYYQYLNTFVSTSMGGQHSCRCIIESVDFANISKKQAAGDWEELHQDMAEIATRLENAGAEIILICANTMHLSVETIKQKISVPLLHIAEAAGREIIDKKCKKVLLLGTKYTMELDFYKDILKQQFELEVFVPNAEDREFIHQSIYIELAKGIISNETKKRYMDIMEKFENIGVDAVVLGCTEIPLLIGQEDSKLTIIDTTKVHAKAAVDYALA
jgi:aspartate racemase